MEDMNIKYFISFKLNSELQNLDQNILDTINNMFQFIDKKNKKINKKPQKIIKAKLPFKRDSITNKVNLILNKLSESNTSNLVLEFIENVGHVTEEEYSDIIKIFYNKIIAEITFVKVYLNFLKIINCIYNQVQGYDIQLFVNLIENKFNSDYIENCEELDESKRINLLILIKTMVDINVMSNNIIDYCTDKLLEQRLYFSDIYYWFTYVNVKDTDKIKIKDILSNNDMCNRDKILLENLLNQTKVEKKQVVVVNNTVSIDVLKLEVANLIEEYILMKNLDDIIYFIDKKCLDAITKNNFCAHLLNIYAVSNKNDIETLNELVKSLVKNQIIFKSNMSRGLIQVDIKWNDDRLKILLLQLKMLGITKGLEKFFKKMNINIM